MRLALITLLHAGAVLPLWAQGNAEQLCQPSRPATGPDILLAAELGAGANAARSDHLPWRFTGRLMPTFMISRARGLGMGAIVGGTTSQPAGAVLGARASARLKSLVNLASLSLPGAELQGGVEYGYIVGGDHAHSLAGTVGLDLVDLARVTIRTNRIFPYNSSSGRVRGQWVFELGVGRTWSLHTPPAPAVSVPDTTEAFTLGKAVAAAATRTRERPATDTTAAEPARCDRAAIAALAAFSSRDAAHIQTRAELLAALRARKLDAQADTINALFPSQSGVTEATQVRRIIAGIQFIFPP